MTKEKAEATVQRRVEYARESRVAFLVKLPLNSQYGYLENLSKNTQANPARSYALYLK